MTRQGFETYKLYLALQRHFTSDYDFHKYNGKVNVSKEAFSKRNDKYSFEKLSRIVTQEEVVDFFVCHFIETPNEWIRNMRKDNLDRYKSKIRKLPSIFQEDINTISQYGPSVLKVGKDIPKIHKLVLEHDITLESLIIMDMLYPFVDRHSEECKVSFVFPDHIKKVKKYRPFLINKIENRDIFRDAMKKALT